MARFRRPFEPHYAPANLLQWHSAARSETITVATGVSDLAAAHGYGDTLSQSTGANQPATGTRTINGQNGLDFDGTNDCLFATSLSNIHGSGAPAMTIFYVLSLDVVDDYMFHYVTAGATWPAKAIALTAYSVDTDFQVLYYNGNSQTDNSGATSTPYLHVNTYQSGGNHGNAVHRLDGASITETIVNSSNALNFDASGHDLYLGCKQDLSIHLNGIFGEMIHLNTELAEGSDLMNKFEGYLGHFWGITLASGHAYEKSWPRC